MHTTNLLAVVVFAPLAGAAILGLLGRKMSERLVGLIACLSVAVSVMAAFYSFFFELWPLLDGYRGRPKADLDALCDALVRLSWLIADLDGRLEDIEVNPLFVREGGNGVLAIDARGVLAPEKEGRT